MWTPDRPVLRPVNHGRLHAARSPAQSGRGAEKAPAEERSLTADGDVGRLAHVVAAVEPLDEVAVLGDDEHGRRDAVHHHDVAGVRDGQPGHDVNAPAPTDDTWLHRHTLYTQDILLPIHRLT